jgi:hypothetical protein
MSPFGVFHTAVSILPIGFGLYAFIRDGKIDPENRVGQLYLVTMLLGSVTAFGFILTKGFTPPQVLTVVTLALLYAGTFTLRGRRRGDGVVQIICLSATYFLLMFFTTTESLTRLPVGHPFASGPTDPALIPTRVALLIAFVVGVAYQVFRLRAGKQRAGSIGHVDAAV